jgi:hypothetical protein
VGGDTWRENFAKRGERKGDTRPLQEYHDQQRRVGDASDPDDVVEELFKEASKATLALIRKWNRSRKGEQLPRVIVDASRETRQLADAYYRILAARGAVAEAQQFFADLDARLQAGALDLDERTRPYLERPA